MTLTLTSFQFLGFVLLAVSAYHLLPQKARWIVMLTASTVFYSSFSPWGLLFLVPNALVSWLCAKQIQRYKDAESAWMSENRKKVDKETRKAKKDYYKKKRDLFVVLTVAVSIAALIMCKYYGAFASSFNDMFGTGFWTAENLILPLGLSYYSLMLISYVVDVSRDIIKAERNPLKVVTFSMCFLSVLQGPFNRYGDLMPQICDKPRHKLSYQSIKSACLRIAWGYVKKLCIADQVGIITNEVFTNYAQYEGLGILFGIFCFALQLYADFSGYMDIVLGIGELFGLTLPENFRQPFFSRNMSEFWKRWHITLGLWLQDYVFYPLLKSRAFKKLGKGLSEKIGKEAGRRIPTYIGMFILWVLIGAWHGAGFNYVFGVGILQFLYIFTGEITMPISVGLKDRLHIKDENIFWHIFQSLRSTALMMFAWVFFNSKSFSAAIGMLKNLFTADIINPASLMIIFHRDGSLLQGQRELIYIIYPVIAACILVVMDLFAEKGISVRRSLMSKRYPIRLIVYLVLIFSIIIFGAYGDMYVASNFIYFEF